MREIYKVARAAEALRVRYLDACIHIAVFVLPAARRIKIIQTIFASEIGLLNYALCRVVRKILQLGQRVDEFGLRLGHLQINRLVQLLCQAARRVRDLFDGGSDGRVTKKLQKSVNKISWKTIANLTYRV